MTSLPMPPRADDQRLWLACGAAALLHLGLMFGLRIGIEPTAPASLEVTLVAAPGSHAPLTARVLAPVAQTGGGDHRELRAQQARANGRMNLPGLRHAADLAMLSAQAPTGSTQLLSTDAASDRGHASSEDLQTGTDASLQLLRREQAGDAAAGAEQEPTTQTPSDDSPRAGMGLSTRASRQAAYRETWRQRVERAGSVNFPWSALAMGQPKSLTLLVAVRADGAVTQARVLRSSGLPMLDQAALDILRLAGPFPPFPENLRQEASELSFAYKWEFFPGNRAALRVGRP
ncbi:MAG: energy transducer TonB [Nevskiales bacterium]